MVRFLISAFLLLNAGSAFGAAGYYGVKSSTTTGTADLRLAGLFCASVSSAVWDTCTVQVDGPNTRVLVGNGVNVSTLTATDLTISTVTATYIWLNGQDLEAWIDSITASTGTHEAEIAALSVSTANLEGWINSTGTALTTHEALTANGAHGGNQVVNTTSDVLFQSIKLDGATTNGALNLLNDGGSAIGRIYSRGTNNADASMWFYGNDVLTRRALIGFMQGTDDPYTGVRPGDFIVAVDSAVTGGIQFASSSTIRMTVSHTGEIGIGTTSPAYKLHVTSAVYVGDDLIVAGDIIGTVDGYAVGTEIAALSVSTANLEGWINSTGTALTSEIARATAREDAIAVSTGTNLLAIQTTAQALTSEISRATAREDAIAVSTGTNLLAINTTAQALTSEIARATAREDAIAVSTGTNLLAINTTAQALTSEISRATIREDAIAVSTGTNLLAINTTAQALTALTLELNTTAQALTVAELAINATAQALTTHEALTANGAHGGDQVVNTDSNVTFASGTFTDDEFSVGLSTFAVTAGRVGIGTTDPDHTLTVSGDVAFSGPEFSVGGSTLTVSTGNVGIHVATPLSLLEIGNNKAYVANIAKANFPLCLTVAGGNRSLCAGMVTDGTHGSGIIKTGNIGSQYSPLYINSDNGQVAIGYSPTEVAVPAGTGLVIKDRVGIGTTAPATLFQVGVGTFAVTQSGLVGIGTTDPAEKLEVKDGSIKLSTTTGSQGIIFQDGTEQTTAFAMEFSSYSITGSSSVASTDYVGVSTMTVNIIKNLRPHILMVTLNIQTVSAGGERTYTVALAEDGVIDTTREITLQATDWGSVAEFLFEPAGDVPGPHYYAVWVKSDNASGDQVARDVKQVLLQF